VNIQKNIGENSKKGRRGGAGAPNPLSNRTHAVRRGNVPRCVYARLQTNPGGEKSLVG